MKLVSRFIRGPGGVYTTAEEVDDERHNRAFPISDVKPAGPIRRVHVHVAGLGFVTALALSSEGDEPYSVFLPVLRASPPGSGG